jgi:excisionase family DNA binding protein
VQGRGVADVAPKHRAQSLQGSGRNSELKMALRQKAPSNRESAFRKQKPVGAYSESALWGQFPRNFLLRNAWRCAILGASRRTRHRRYKVQTKAEHKEWFTTEGLVRWLGLGRTKTYELLRSGELPSYKIGRVRRIRRRDVEAWLERNRYRPAE